MSSRKKKVSGYRIVADFNHRLFNIVVSLILILFAVPFYVVLALLLKFRLGGPPIYKGIRLGKGKKPFTMYKFRTLPLGSDRVIGAELLSNKFASENQLLTGLGKYLRETRLDELPQLFNVLKGDMNLIGPRPERPEIYEKFCREISGYDKRFQVKPGIIGYSQLMTPHSTPKRIRAFIDNKYLLQDHRLLMDILIILKTIRVILLRAVRLPFSYLFIVSLKGKRLTVRNNRRTLVRTRLKDAHIYLEKETPAGKEFVRTGCIWDINEDALLVYTRERDFPVKNRARIMVGIRCGRFKTKTASIVTSYYDRVKTHAGEEKYGYVLKYQPATPLDYYLIHQYFIRTSIVRF